ncbi:MAG: HPr(Ser) kinase/phosphatase [Clostridia bacterium]|nr:HPr(Ser) kinase/phosphatase [Clostridia bacterium]MBR2943790.1 HPr(Ser) kinase/phosphatase [Clostridia bacterium]
MDSPTTQRTVLLTKIIKDFNLEIIYAPENLDSILLTRAEIHRPGLPLTGFFDYFDPLRMQILGLVESIYLEKLEPSVRYERIRAFMEKKPVCIVLARDIEPFSEMLEMSKEFDIPLLRTKISTNSFVSNIISTLNVELAPTITRHGVLVEVYGEGVLILGDSGIGKSETAIELIKRGHRLIADDAVEISKVSEKTLVGKAPEIIRHYTELRGIGIVDIRRIFGMGAVKETEKIQLIIKLEHWVDGKTYDRMGLDNETFTILGIDIPAITIPVRPGRNLAVVLEIAAMNSRLKRMGYNTAEEFNKKLEEVYK